MTVNRRRRRVTISDVAAELGLAKGAGTVSRAPIDYPDIAPGTRATAAQAAGDPPDVIYHPLQYALPWTEAGILRNPVKVVTRSTGNVVTGRVSASGLAGLGLAGGGTRDRRIGWRLTSAVRGIPGSRSISTRLAAKPPTTTAPRTA